MAVDMKLTDLTPITVPSPTDLMYIVTHIGSTPTDNSIAFSNLLALFTATANKTVANSNSETSLIGTGVGSMTIPAAYFAVGRVLRFNGSGFFSNTGTPTITGKLKLGSTIIGSTGAITTGSGVSNVLFSFDLLLTCRTTGATGTVIGSGFFGIGNSVYVLYPTSGATSTVDTTGTLAADVTGQWSAADPANTLSIVNFALTRLN